MDDAQIVKNMSEAEKYRAFRNFMTNELGIGREDIRAWVTSSISEAVGKLVGQINLQQMAQNEIAQHVRSAVSNAMSDSFRGRTAVESALRDVIQAQYTVTVVEKERKPAQ